jgi:hypothetical protein
MSWFGCKTFYGHDLDGSWNKYLTRLNVGRLCLHIMWRGDGDQDCHDHPWDFWTFPLVNYVEVRAHLETNEQGFLYPVFTSQVVSRFKWHYRPCTYTHRVVGKWLGKGTAHPNAYPGYGPGIIVTIIWKSKVKRAWGFFKKDTWCWVPWREYLKDKGKDYCGED